MIGKNKINFLLVVAYLFLSCNVNADPLILFSVNKKYGYVDQNLKIVIPPEYEHAEHFSKNGFAIVRFKEKHSGIIDQQGEIIFERSISNIYYIAENLYSYAESNDVYMIFRLSDKKTIASGLGTPGYSGSDPYILIRTMDRQSDYEFIDFNGNKFPVSFQMKRYSYPFYEGRAVITKTNWDYSIINLQGKEISSLRLFRIGQKYSEGLIPAQTEEMVTGYINLDGVFEFEIPFIVGDQPNATEFSNGFALIKTAQNPDMWVVINKSGKTVSNPIMVTDAYAFSEGLSIVSKYDVIQKKYVYGYINTKGDYLVPPILDRCDSFKDGYARVIFKGKDGLLDTKGMVYWSDWLLDGKTEGELLSSTHL